MTPHMSKPSLVPMRSPTMAPSAYPTEVPAARPTCKPSHSPTPTPEPLESLAPLQHRPVICHQFFCHRPTITKPYSLTNTLTSSCTSCSTDWTRFPQPSYVLTTTKLCPDQKIPNHSESSISTTELPTARPMGAPLLPTELSTAN